MKKLITLFGFIFLYVNTWAQVNLPEIFFVNYQQHYAPINPAHLGFSESKSVDLRYASYNGAKKVLKSMYADVVFNPIDSLRIRSGLQAYAFHEGDFIQYNNIKWLNSYSVTNQRDFKLAFALGLGAVNYSYVNNVEQASDWGFDMDAGLWLEYKKWNVGLSGKHILPTILKPIETTFKLNQMAHFIVRYKLINALNTSLETSVHYVYNSQVFMDLPLSLYNHLVYKKTLVGICNVNGLSLLTIGVGFQENKQYHLPFSLNIAFQQKLNDKTITPNNRYEIGLHKKF